MDTNTILPQGLGIPDLKKQTRWIKAVVLAVLAAGFFGLTWQFLAIGLSTSHSLFFWFWPTLAAAFGVSFLALLAIADQNKYLYWASNSAIFVLYILLLPKQLKIYLGGVIFILFVFLFEKYVRDDEYSRTGFSLNRIVWNSINFIIYGLLIVLGLNIYVQIKNKLQENPDAVYSQIGHYAARGLNYVPSGIGDYNPDQTFDDFVIKQAQSQQPQIVSAPQSVQNQAIEDFKKQLENKFNLHISGNPLLGEVVAGAVAGKIKESAGSYSKFFPAIFALLIVIALSYAAFLFVGLTSIICWLLFKVLLATKFFRIEKVQVEVDKLQI